MVFMAAFDIIVLISHIRVSCRGRRQIQTDDGGAVGVGAQISCLISPSLPEESNAGQISLFFLLLPDEMTQALACSAQAVDRREDAELEHPQWRSR